MKDINIANNNTGKFAGVKWEGHQVLVINEFTKGVDHKGKANDKVIINWAVIVKLKGNSPIMFQDNILNEVNTKGFMNLLKGIKADPNCWTAVMINKDILLRLANFFTEKGIKKGIIIKIQLSFR